MNKFIFFVALGLSGSTIVNGAPAPESIRTIRLRQDDAQVRFTSRIYELKHVSSEEILPFINSAILRYNRNSTIRRVTASTPGVRDAILVSTGVDFISGVDDIVKALDRPGRVKGGPNSITGTGLSRVAYSPKYRAAAELANIIDNTTGSSSGASYVNAENNTIFWRDQSTAAQNTLKWLDKLDRPLPQVNIRLNYYELRDSDLRDWGFDYLAWKNGPGVNLFNVGYNAGNLIFDQLLEGMQFAATSGWGFGGFFTAPQIDMSFIRCLEQSGSASVVANGMLTMVSTPVRTLEDYQRLLKYQTQNGLTAPFVYRVSMTPEYQNISKNTLGRSLVGKSYYEDESGIKHADPPTLNATIINPFICCPDNIKSGDNGGVLFNYTLNFKNVVERGNTGAELSNSAQFSGGASLKFGCEKILAIYEKENDVEQTLGLPILCRIPVIKYFFSTVTSIKERTYIIVSAEASPIEPDIQSFPNPKSVGAGVKRRIENPFRKIQE